MEITQRKTADLIPYVNNARTHSEQQVLQIAASIKEFGFNSPVLVDGENGIIAGHGRVMAAKKLGLDEVPTIELKHLTKTQKKAYILADNRLALNSGWDNDLLALELGELSDDGFDLDLLGFDDTEFNVFDDTEKKQIEKDEKYTAKTDVFTYEPTGEKPDLNSLLDDTKTKELISEIKKSDLPKEEKDFLISAAYRHSIFNFEHIANYYAHSDEKTQEFMEKSALVIVDFDDAIAGGFVNLTQEIKDLVEKNG